MKFRKKPVEIEAEQFDPDDTAQHERLGIEMSADEDGSLCIPTLEGNMTVTEGDWIITGVLGERYPCKPNIFEQTYEKVEE